ncbi:hypothetical protein BCCH1_78580 (plasmid) [Burkholderia contaminans]|uniref:Lipoprotein n=2 Tax=Burkholderia contaminans TaxID=488447 RepID=A0A250LLF7_9BURK|nr:hypothetical protein BCCH1_78580 [Burkholderia contaminans]
MGGPGTRVLITFAISLLLAAACVVLKQHLPAEQPIDQGPGLRHCEVDAKAIRHRADGSVSVPKGATISCERSLSANPRDRDGTRETIIVKSRS